MARLRGEVGVKNVTTGTSAKTILQIQAPAHQDVVVEEVSIGFHDTVNTDAPVTVELVVQSTGGTMSTSTIEPLDGRLSSTLFQTVAQNTASSEPTATYVVHTFPPIHPQTGGTWTFKDLVVERGTYLGLRVTAATSTTADANMKIEE
jgi:hypothetical protein